MASTGGETADAARAGAAAWSNWSGSVRCQPARIARPEDAEAVRAEVARATAEGLEVRVAGSGHSFSPLVATRGLLLSLERHAGLDGVSQGADGVRARVRAGITLRDLGEALHGEGLALHNLGDVDVQALAGALATGTHGTGPALANLSSAVRRLALVLAGGERLVLDETDGERLAAARVSLGALGVIESVELAVVPAHRLHQRVSRPPCAEGLAAVEAEIASHRHFEIFWFPARDLLETKSLDPTDSPPESVTGRRYERIDWSHRVLPSERLQRFNEMEYALPAAAGPECFRQLRARMLARHADVEWPVEYRSLAADSAWLSPAHGRATVTISVHQAARLPCQALFADLEPLLREHGGRPHWGKVHGLTAVELAPLYPRWEDFLAVRAELDPQQRFLNAHLRRVLLD